MAGVDWLLGINGARVASHSPTLDPCVHPRLAGAWGCTASGRVLAAVAGLLRPPPAQLNPDTLLALSAGAGPRRAADPYLDVDAPYEARLGRWGT